MKNAALILSLLATPAAAQDLIVQFENTSASHQISLQASGCNISNAILLIDLDGSQSGYRFDASNTTDLLEAASITKGYGALSPVKDGDTSLQVLVRSLGIGDTLDLQTALAQSDAPVATGSGIEGASVRVALSDRVVSSVFDAAGTARIALPLDDKVCLAAAN